MNIDIFIPLHCSSEMSAGECQTKNRNEYDKVDDDAPIKALDEDDIALLKTYGIGPYANAIKNVEEGN